ncbi:MAG: hypothetical protein KF832_25215 [Caldilineaceae bacterium]|nr:hypothetical protein [Caldilineaceae bacterium]
MAGEWIELRCDGKMHGQVNSDLTLVTAKGDWVYVYDLPATLREQRPVVTRLRAADYHHAPVSAGKTMPIIS